MPMAGRSGFIALAGARCQHCGTALVGMQRMWCSRRCCRIGWAKSTRHGRCAGCGGGLPGDRKKWCSADCRRQYAQRHPRRKALHELTCRRCGSQFRGTSRLRNCDWCAHHPAEREPEVSWADLAKARFPSCGWAWDADMVAGQSRPLDRLTQRMEATNEMSPELIAFHMRGMTAQATVEVARVYGIDLSRYPSLARQLAAAEQTCPPTASD